MILFPMYFAYAIAWQLFSIFQLLGIPMSWEQVMQMVCAWFGFPPIF